MEWLHTEPTTSVLLQTPQGKTSKFLHKLQKALFACATVRQRKSVSYQKDVGVSLALAGVGTIQGLSLVFRVQDEIQGYSDFQAFFSLLNYFRFDVVAVRYQWATPFLGVMLVAVYLPVVLLTANVAMGISCKRKPLDWSIRLMISLLTALKEVLLIPSLVLMVSYLKYTFFLSDASTMTEYFSSAAPLCSLPQATLCLFALPTLLAELHLSTSFLYENVFAKRLLRIHAMSNSLLPRLHLLCTFLMVLCYSLLSELREHWYRLAIALLSLCLYTLNLYQLPYYNSVLNVRFAASQAILVWGVVAFYIGYWADSAGAIIALLAFVCPAIVSLAYTHTQLSTEKGRFRLIREIKSELQLDFKLRGLLEQLEGTAKEHREEIHANVRDLFVYGVLNMRKSPMLPIWEANYYFYALKDAFLATLKLSKVHVTSQTLETAFFTLKSSAKFCSNEDSPARSYLKYQILLSQAKQLDENFCVSMLSLCSELLRTHPDAKKCEKLVEKVALLRQKTVNKYLKLLKTDPENPAVLRLLGSFLLDLLKEETGRNYLLRAQMRRGSDYSRSSALFYDLSGTLVLSCSLPSPACVAFADSKACKALRLSAGELVGKDLGSLLPQEAARARVGTVGKLVLLSYDLEPVRTLLKVLLDSQGLIAPVSVSVQVTTWVNAPYLLLSLKEWSSPQVRLLLDANWFILHHSSLAMLFTDIRTPQFRYLHIHSLLPEFLQQCEDSGEVLYVDPGGLRWNITVEVITIEKVELKLMTITKGDMISIYSSMGSKRHMEDFEKKAVRFGGRAHSNGSTIPSDAALFSESKLKRQLTLASSIQSSVQGSKLQEVDDSISLHRLTKRLSVLLLLCFAITIADVTGSLTYTTKLLSSLETTDTLSAYVRRNELLVELAYEARSLLLADDPAYEYDSVVVSANIKAKTVELKTIIDTMKQRVEADPVEVRAKATELKIPSWQLIAGHIVYEQTSLLAGLMRIASAALRLASSRPPYLNSTEGFYIVRNAVGETLEELNKTLTVLTKKDQEGREENLTIISLLVIICFIILVIPLIVLVAPQIYRLEHLQQRFWMRLYVLPTETLVTMRTAVQERLQDTFDIEDFPSESVSTGVRQGSKPSAVWTGLGRKLTLYVACTLVLLFVVQFSFASALLEVAVTIPNYAYWAGLRPFWIQHGSFWTREQQLLSQPLSYSSLVSTGSYWPRPLSRIANNTAGVDFTSRILDLGSTRYGIITTKKSSRYNNYLFSSACGALLQAGCTEQASQYGSRYMVKEWRATVLASTREAVSKGGMAEWLRKLEMQTYWARNGAFTALEFYRADSLEQLDALTFEMVLVCIVYILCTLLLYVLVYLPSIHAIHRRSLQSIFIHKAFSCDCK